MIVRRLRGPFAAEIAGRHSSESCQHMEKTRHGTPTPAASFSANVMRGSSRPPAGPCGLQVDMVTLAVEAKEKPKPRTSVFEPGHVAPPGDCSGGGKPIVGHVLPQRSAREMTQAAEVFTSTACVAGILRDSQRVSISGAGGIGTPHENASKRELLDPGGAKSGAPAMLDPSLTFIIDAWECLPDPIKAGILAIVRAAGR
ncbi:hypothetical protein PX52LOC_02422 [Limnoglobus roseus]|uniref:Uncharacterized protein n=1 Tax=Limnoglobus roseus TaxID=2598579 RepID=A0A5C1A845_9BACT|nr:hypothetical protein PX52LOC_02422 [Limnoglobus roseus]